MASQLSPSLHHSGQKLSGKKLSKLPIQHIAQFMQVRHLKKAQKLCCKVQEGRSMCHLRELHRGSQTVTSSKRHLSKAREVCS